MQHILKLLVSFCFHSHLSFQIFFVPLVFRLHEYVTQPLTHPSSAFSCVFKECCANTVLIIFCSLSLALRFDLWIQSNGRMDKTFIR